MKNGQQFAKSLCKTEWGKGLGTFLMEDAPADTHHSSSDFLWDVGRFVVYIQRSSRETKCTGLFGKVTAVLSSFVGCLLDYLKTEEGSQLNLPKLIDMSAQVSEQSLRNRLKTRICYRLSEILASLKSVRVLISWRKPAPPGVVSQGFSLSALLC